MKIPTRQTPFSFVYGMKVVTSIKLRIPTTQVAGYNPIEDEAAQARSLDLLLSFVMHTKYNMQLSTMIIKFS